MFKKGLPTATRRRPRSRFGKSGSVSRETPAPDLELNQEAECAGCREKHEKPLTERHSKRVPHRQQLPNRRRHPVLTGEHLSVYV